MRDFITDTCQGDEEATFAPPNRRFMPLDLLMPSTYSEAMEDLVVAGDTSGSMGPLYPVMFGEVAQILRTVKPRKVHVVWWDTEVAAVQTFDENSYDNIKDVLKPAGGGGTSPQCVLDYLSTNKIDPAAIVWLTDGYIDNFKTLPSCPSLWGVLDNERFTPPFGKVVHVRSVCL
jgi:predicted metal-dependent peptidase